uniref:Uncharacterized protein n=1 Tax=Brassica oleracea var. oleracea TaxID=109376 RepID=A0A0D3AUR5_BRAOL
YSSLPLSPCLKTKLSQPPSQLINEINKFISDLPLFRKFISDSVSFFYLIG